MKMKTIHAPLWIVLGLAVGFSGGCEKEVQVSLIPSFYSTDLKIIAVAPFRNATRVRDVGNIISDTLAAQLSANGTYKVYNRNDLESLRDEHDLRSDLGLSNADIAKKFRKVGKVQAVLVGRVITYTTNERRENRRDPIYATNAQGVMYIAGYRNYVFTRNDANVVATASLIRVADGTTLASTASPATGNFWAQGSPPTYDKFACLTVAMKKCVNQLSQLQNS